MSDNANPSTKPAAVQAVAHTEIQYAHEANLGPDITEDQLHVLVRDARAQDVLRGILNFLRKSAAESLATASGHLSDNNVHAASSALGAATDLNWAVVKLHNLSLLPVPVDEDSIEAVD